MDSHFYILTFIGLVRLKFLFLCFTKRCTPSVLNEILPFLSVLRVLISYFASNSKICGVRMAVRVIRPAEITAAAGRNRGKRVVSGCLLPWCATFRTTIRFGINRKRGLFFLTGRIACEQKRWLAVNQPDDQKSLGLSPDLKCLRCVAPISAKNKSSPTGWPSF